jgi:hypothetical protein
MRRSPTFAQGRTARGNPAPQARQSSGSMIADISQSTAPPAYCLPLMKKVGVESTLEFVRAARAHGPDVVQKLLVVKHASKLLL